MNCKICDNELKTYVIYDKKDKKGKIKARDIKCINVIPCKCIESMTAILVPEGIPIARNGEIITIGGKELVT